MLKTIGPANDSLFKTYITPHGILYDCVLISLSLSQIVFVCCH